MLEFYRKLLFTGVHYFASVDAPNEPVLDAGEKDKISIDDLYLEKSQDKKIDSKELQELKDRFHVEKDLMIGKTQAQYRVLIDSIDSDLKLAIDQQYGIDSKEKLSLNKKLEKYGVEDGIDNVLSSYDKYMSSKLDGLSPSILAKIKQSIGMRVQNLGDKIDSVEERMNDLGEQDTPRNFRWVVNGAIKDAFSEIDNKILPSALLLAKYTNETNKESFIEKAIKDMNHQYSDQMPKDTVKKHLTRDFKHKIEQIEEMFAAELDTDGQFDEFGPETLNQANTLHIDNEGRGDSQIFKNIGGEESDFTNISILSEADQETEKQAMKVFIGMIIAHITIEVGPAVLASVVPVAGTAAGAIVGAAIGGTIDVTDMVSDREVLMQIAQSGNLVPDEYRMDKTMLDNVLAGIGLLPGATIAIKAARANKLISKFNFSADEIAEGTKVATDALGSHMKGTKKTADAVDSIKGEEVATPDVNKLRAQLAAEESAEAGVDSTKGADVGKTNTGSRAVENGTHNTRNFDHAGINARAEFKDAIDAAKKGDSVTIGESIYRRVNNGWQEFPKDTLLAGKDMIEGTRRSDNDLLQAFNKNKKGASMESATDSGKASEAVNDASRAVENGTHNTRNFDHAGINARAEFKDAIDAAKKGDSVTIGESIYRRVNNGWQEFPKDTLLAGKDMIEGTRRSDNDLLQAFNKNKKGASMESATDSGKASEAVNDASRAVENGATTPIDDIAGVPNDIKKAAEDLAGGKSTELPKVDAKAAEEILDSAKPLDSSDIEKLGGRRQKLVDDLADQFADPGDTSKAIKAIQDEITDIDNKLIDQVKHGIEGVDTTKDAAKGSKLKEFFENNRRALSLAALGLLLLALSQCDNDKLASIGVDCEREETPTPVILDEGPTTVKPPRIPDLVEENELLQTTPYTVQNKDTYVTAIRDNLITQIPELADMSVKDILAMKHNGIADIDKVYPGDTIQLKKVGASWDVFVVQNKKPAAKPPVAPIEPIEPEDPEAAKKAPSENDIMDYVFERIDGDCSCGVNKVGDKYECSIIGLIKDDFSIEYGEDFYDNLDLNIEEINAKVKAARETAAKAKEEAADKILFTKLKKVAEKGGDETLHTFKNEKGTEIKITVSKNSRDQVWLRLDTPNMLSKNRDGITDRSKKLAQAVNNMPTLESVKKLMAEWEAEYKEKDTKLQNKREEKKDAKETKKAERLDKRLEKVIERTGIDKKDIKALADEGIMYKKTQRNGDFVFNRKGVNDIVISKDFNSITDERNKLGDLDISKTSFTISEVALAIDAYLKLRFSLPTKDRISKEAATEAIQRVINDAPSDIEQVIAGLSGQIRA
ncbi:hypothetical protein OAN96_01105 [Candidatus Gracilibacteria bacterium]|nr:hypothetical protein [Candidatus Gracilibacteria bacterium]